MTDRGLIQCNLCQGHDFELVEPVRFDGTDVVIELRCKPCGSAPGAGHLRVAAPAREVDPAAAKRAPMVIPPDFGALAEECEDAAMDLPAALGRAWELGRAAREEER